MPKLTLIDKVCATTPTLANVTKNFRTMHPADEMIIVLASDSEGNRMSQMSASVTIGYYKPIDEESGELIESFDDPADSIPCVVLWPVK